MKQPDEKITKEFPLFVPVGESDLTSLSQENLEKVKVLNELLPSYLKTHVIPNNKYSDYGVMFDSFYSKDLGELIILNELYK